MADNVNHPSHYETGKFECIDVMVETQGVEATKNFCVCNIEGKYTYNVTFKNEWVLPLSVSCIYNPVYDKPFINFSANISF